MHANDAIPKALDRDLVDLYRSWDLLEQRTQQPRIIDFDLASPHDVSPAADRGDVIARLTTLLERSESLAPDWRDLVAGRLRASMSFLRAQAGEPSTLGDYVEATMGVKPHRVPEADITRQRELVDESFRHLSHRRANAAQPKRPSRQRSDVISFNARDFHRFESSFIVPDYSLLPRHFDFYREKWLPRLLNRLDVSIDDYTIRMNFASEDAYWKNWISGDLAGHQIDFRINVHPRHSWYVGAAETLALHEYCGHAIQMICWHRQIENGRLPEFAGILTVHFPDQFLLEGLAEIMSYWLPDDALNLEPKSMVLRELHAHTLLVMNNVHIIANDDSREAAIEYATERLPFSKRESLAREVRDRTGHPLYRCYQYVYGIAKQQFGDFLNRLSPRQAARLIELAYEGPMTPGQLNARADHLASA